MKKAAVLLSSSVILSLPFLFSPPPGLSVEGFKTLAVFLVCVLWWITNIVPIMVTSLLAIVSFPILGLASSEEVYSYFGNTAVFFLVGSFILSSALRRKGITQKMALSFVKVFGKTSRSLALSFLFVAYLLSLIMISHAVVAVLIPVILEFSGLREDKESKDFVKVLLLSTFWGAVLGGNTTLLGGARAPLVLAMFQPYYSEGLSFLRWLSMSFPVTFTLLLLAAFFVTKWTPNVDIEELRRSLLERKEQLSSSREQLVVSVIAFVTILTWICASEKVGVANIALGSVIALFLTGTISWREVEEDVNWGVILMYGGAIVLGRMMNRMGVAEWITSSLNLGLVPGWLLIILLIVAGMLLTEVMSNSAAAVILTQLSFPLIGKVGLSPEAMTVIISMATGFAFVLPTGSPSTALVVSTGYLDVRDLAKRGVIMSVLSFGILLLFVNTLWRHVL
ncbi:hypothetical protein TRQ7_01635 [Thermotoga sp. RQ7]|jgi:sodium-dependent dicarboxylate transporter 2/3/5|uniref:SLC13 family permease n=1 Tax=Thermotoga sp. RQ7 TaxID=126738 RepID=UPI0005A332F9|nr:DASS family sodium-coupled anion symporter [Thermotoga sp. RQ7]AJG40174.1 hypothetical protein TRQ7_01635 [Thermotoga sp. RQ7]